MRQAETGLQITVKRLNVGTLLCLVGVAVGLLNMFLHLAINSFEWVGFSVVCLLISAAGLSVSRPLVTRETKTLKRVRVAREAFDDSRCE